MSDLIRGRIVEDVGLQFEDASAWSFGWEFQANAGLYLFIKQIKTAKSVAIETKFQDIVIDFVDDTSHYIQAKSSQKANNNTNGAVKFKDALLSLAKTSARNNDKLIYVTNLYQPLLNDDTTFRNSLQWFDDCPINIQNEVKKRLDEVCARVKGEIESKNISNKRKKTLKEIHCRLENFCLDNLGIITLYPYNQNAESKNEILRQEILKMLGDMTFSSNDANVIVNRLLDRWQGLFRSNSTVKDDFNKSISKREFIWPVVVFLSDFDLNKIVSLLSFTADDDQEMRAQIYLRESWVYHERFEFINKVLKGFADFKKTFDRAAGSSPNDEFVRRTYVAYESEFAQIEEKELREIVVKAFLYKIIKDYSNQIKVLKAVSDENQ